MTSLCRILNIQKIGENIIIIKRYIDKMYIANVKFKSCSRQTFLKDYRKNYVLIQHAAKEEKLFLKT